MNPFMKKNRASPNLLPISSKTAKTNNRLNPTSNNACGDRVQQERNIQAICRDEAEQEELRPYQARSNPKEERTAVRDQNYLLIELRRQASDSRDRYYEQRIHRENHEILETNGAVKFMSQLYNNFDYDGDTRSVIY